MMRNVRYKAVQFNGFTQTDYYFQITNGRKLSPIPHTHDFYEICVLFSGETVHCIDGKDLKMSAGDCVFLSPKNVHFYRSQAPDTNAFSLSVTAKKFEEMRKALGFTPVFGVPFSLRESLRLREIERLFFVAQKEQIIRFNELFSRLFSASQALQFSNETEYPPFLSEALKKMRRAENLERGVNALLDLTGYSHAQLCRLTKLHCQKTPRELILQIRMEISKEYLEKSDLSLERISELVGYNSLSQFHAAVKAFYGKTPGTLRKGNLYH